MWRYLSAVFSLLVSFQVAAEPAGVGPVFEEYGPTFAIEGLDVPVDKGMDYKAVFDASAYPGDVTAINVELESVARFINMHARHGVPLENMHLAVVLHGEALKSALAHDAYRERYDVENPNLALLMQLAEAGVRLYVCGQSLGFRDFEASELVSQVDVALSAMTMLTVLQAEGYALLP